MYFFFFLSMARLLGINQKASTSFLPRLLLPSQPSIGPPTSKKKNILSVIRESGSLQSIFFFSREDGGGGGIFKSMCTPKQLLKKTAYAIILLIINIVKVYCSSATRINSIVEMLARHFSD